MNKTGRAFVAVEAYAQVYAGQEQTRAELKRLYWWLTLTITLTLLAGVLRFWLPAGIGVMVVLGQLGMISSTVAVLHFTRHHARWWKRVVYRELERGNRG